MLPASNRGQQAARSACPVSCTGGGETPTFQNVLKVVRSPLYCKSRTLGPKQSPPQPPVKQAKQLVYSQEEGRDLLVCACIYTYMYVYIRMYIERISHGPFESTEIHNP